MIGISISGMTFVVTAGFKAFDDQRVGAFFLHAFSEFDARHDRDRFNAGTVQRFEVRHRIARADGRESNFFFANNFEHFIFIRRLQHQIHAEGMIG